MKHIKNLIVALLSFLTMYLLAAFVEANLNIYEWERGTRFAVVFIVVMIWGAVAGLSYLDNK